MLFSVEQVAAVAGVHEHRTPKTNWLAHTMPAMWATILYAPALPHAVKFFAGPAFDRVAPTKGRPHAQLENNQHRSRAYADSK